MGWGGFVWIVIIIALLAAGGYGLRNGLSGPPPTVVLTDASGPAKPAMPSPTAPAADNSQAMPATAIFVPPAASPRPKETPIPYTAEQLVAFYDSDSEHAGATLKGHQLKVTGIVFSISKGAFGGAYVTLKGESHTIHGVRCFISGAEQPAGLQVGKTVTAVGECEGIADGGVHLDNVQLDNGNDAPR
jgi:hypothetical protein